MKVIHNKVAGDSPQLNLEAEKKMQDNLLSLIGKGLIKSAHDISEGGIICAIAECCIMDEENLIGAEINIFVKSRNDFSFFSESQSRVIVSVNEQSKDEFEQTLKSKDQAYYLLGRTGGTKLNVNNLIQVDINKLADLYFNTISDIMNSEE